jgi:flagellar basal-body rod protein FlgB
VSSLDGTQAILEAAMRGAWQRQSLLTNNMANVDTPGYQREELDFQSTLQGALAGGESLEGVSFQPQVEAKTDSPNGNGVSIEQEAALLSENGLDYEALTEMLGSHDETLRAAMGL